MELIMLGKEDKKNLLVSVDAEKKQQEQQKEGHYNVVIYDPSPTKVVDKRVLEELAERRGREIETRKRMLETKEEENLINTTTLTDVPATIKKAGFHPDGSPKVAIAGLFDKDVEFVVRNEQAQYRSSSLSVVLAEVITDRKNLICFIVGFVSILVSIALTVIKSSCEYLCLYEQLFLCFFGIILPFSAFVFVSLKLENTQYFKCLKLSNISKARMMFDVHTKVPSVPESVLAKITGHGPFAILFEVSEGWRNIEPDPVILRIINIKDKQFFEPVLGYDMTPLERSSLVET